MRRLRLDPAMLPTVIEEVLRYVSPVQASFRRASRDVRMYDQVIPAGAMVSPWLGSANRDPEAFADADTFSIDRKPGGQIAFGPGIHFCIGALLARLETEVLIATMLAELPGEWAIPDVFSVYPVREMCGLNSLPLTWTG
ncbi:cytochrome P450 [Amycolatopsis sp. cmx-4-61]|uniref:cytochrome P450 n=1 Tax=Amycolatopsis sp. cmx-4-61 TaxID=2790937 RepID=UPI00397CEC35